MARITRKTLTMYGGTGPSADFGQFGSQAASAPVETKDVAVLQQLAAWGNGFQDAVAIGQAPYLQDMNSVLYVHSYMDAYLFQEGVAEWDAGTTYYTGSLVKSLANAGFTEFYVSLVDTNLNNALPTRVSNGNWAFLYALDSTGMIVLLAGVTDASNAAAGVVGEFMISTVGNQAAPASTHWGDMTSLSLTAGDWDVTLTCAMNQVASTVTDQEFGLGVTSGDNTPGTSQLLDFVSSASPIKVPMFLRKRFNLNTPTVVYAKMLFNYSGGTVFGLCSIQARRIR